MDQKTIQKAIFDANPRSGIKFAQERSKLLVKNIASIAATSIKEITDPKRYPIKEADLLSKSLVLCSDMIYAGSAPSVVGFPKQCVTHALISLSGEGEEE